MRIDVRVYYEDTDLGGVVYYANYLRYFERGRTELLREGGVELSTLHEEGTIFVVVHAEARYHSPARYGDLITVESVLSSSTGATITFDHRILRGDELLVAGVVTLACVGERGRAVRVPKDVTALMGPQ